MENVLRQYKGLIIHKKEKIFPKVLIEYYKVIHPQFWLFENTQKEIQYSPKSIQYIMKNSLKNAVSRNHFIVYSSKHSFATHPSEQGIDLRFIQELLEHNSTKTTEIHTHVSTEILSIIVSPAYTLFSDKVRGYKWFTRL